MMRTRLEAIPGCCGASVGEKELVSRKSANPKYALFSRTYLAQVNYLRRSANRVLLVDERAANRRAHDVVQITRDRVLRFVAPLSERGDQTRKTTTINKLTSNTTAKAKPSAMTAAARSRSTKRTSTPTHFACKTQWGWVVLGWAGLSWVEFGRFELSLVELGWFGLVWFGIILVWCWSV